MRLHIDYSDMLLEKRRASDAQREYSEAIRIDSRVAEAYYGLGNALTAGRQTTAAINAFQSAIERNRDFYEAHLALGTALAASGNTADARSHLRKAAESSDPAISNAALKALR